MPYYMYALYPKNVEIVQKWWEWRPSRPRSGAWTSSRSTTMLLRRVTQHTAAAAVAVQIWFINATLRYRGRAWLMIMGHFFCLSFHLKVTFKIFNSNFLEACLHFAFGEQRTISFIVVLQGSLFRWAPHIFCDWTLNIVYIKYITTSLFLTNKSASL